MERGEEIMFGKVLGDVLFGVGVTALMLKARGIILTNAVNEVKLSTVARGLLAYEKKRQINSSIFYLKRTAIYIGGACISNIAGELTQQTSVSRFLKGLLWGSCFLSPLSGLTLATINGSIGHFLEPQILQLF